MSQKQSLTIPVSCIISLVLGEDTCAAVDPATFEQERDTLLAHFGQTQDDFVLPAVDTNSIPAKFNPEDPWVKGVIVRCGPETIFGVAFLDKESDEISATYMLNKDDMPEVLSELLATFSDRARLVDEMSPSLNSKVSPPMIRALPAGWRTSRAAIH